MIDNRLMAKRTVCQKPIKLKAKCIAHWNSMRLRGHIVLVGITQLIKPN